jgi:ABC-type Mn2+/Zn2+ transport system ATPase subunit
MNSHEKKTPSLEPIANVLESNSVINSYIRAQNLNIGYSKELIVPNINFALDPGQALALIGTNGSGKSTLLKTIVGILPPISGQLSVFGVAPGSNHRRMAYLGQFHASGFVLPIRVIDVVRMGRFPLLGLLKKMTTADNDIVADALRIMGIEQLANEPLRSLSGGQQQRTYLAQVLAHQADLLVLDEPTSGLDAGGREKYLLAIDNELSRGASVIVATHDIQEEAALCQQVMLLAGKVVALGAPKDVLIPETLLETFGIVVAGEKNLHVLETKHGHNDTKRQNPDQPS